MMARKRTRAGLVVTPTHRIIQTIQHLAEAKTSVFVIHAYLIRTMVLLHNMIPKLRPHRHQVFGHVLKLQGKNQALPLQETLPEPRTGMARSFSTPILIPRRYETDPSPASQAPLRGRPRTGEVIGGLNCTQPDIKHCKASLHDREHLHIQYRRATTSQTTNRQQQQPYHGTDIARPRTRLFQPATLSHQSQLHNNPLIDIHAHTPEHHPHSPSRPSAKKTNVPCAAPANLPSAQPATPQTASATSNSASRRTLYRPVPAAPRRL